MTIWSRRDLKIFGPAELKTVRTTPINKISNIYFSITTSQLNQDAIYAQIVDHQIVALSDALIYGEGPDNVTPKTLIDHTHNDPSQIIDCLDDDTTGKNLLSLYQAFVFHLNP